MNENSDAQSSPLFDIATIRAAIESRSPNADEMFDRIYPSTQRYRSRIHWTPIDTARLVSEWLISAPGGNVLDVGSGVGKACHVAALVTDVTWTGIEKNPGMVRVATRVSRELGLQSRAKFICGEALALDWSPFGGVYLFNPFLEAVYAKSPADLTSRRAAYTRDVFTVEHKLLTLQPGARVVTYHGFGGEMPDGFTLLESVPMHEDFACLWSRSATTGG